jgi:fatty-acyl-CoA synthase
VTQPQESRTLGDLVDHAAEALPSREGLVCGDERITFAQIRDEVDRAARGLIALGIAPGEHVLLWLVNSARWLYTFYALAKIGAVIVPINTRFRSDDFAYVLAQSDATTLIVADEAGGTRYLDIVRQLVPELDLPGSLRSTRYPHLARVVVLAHQAPPGAIGWPALLDEAQTVAIGELALRAERVDPTAPVLMRYTSGTTGAPKGAFHSHAMVRTVADAASRLGITARDAILLFLPLFHSMGLYPGGMLFLASGARLVLMERFDAGEAWRSIAAERVTLLLGFDTHYFDLLEHSDARVTDRSSVRLGMVPAGAAGVEPIARRVNRELCRSFSGYGSSECGTAISLTFIDAPEDERCLGSGFPMPGYEYETRDPQSGQRTPPGLPSELFVRGYGVMLGYYGKPAETTSAFDAAGWFRTGDMATISPDGFLRYLGRYKDMLKVDGENVDPTEVEAFLESHPGIAQVKIVGIADVRLGEAPLARVITRAGQAGTLDAIRAFCRDRIASFKIPRALLIVEAFPLTTTGKVQRGQLRALAQTRPDRVERW